MPEISIKAEELFHLAGVPITNSILLTFVVFFFLILSGLYVNRGLSLVPGKIQSIFELFIEYILELMDSVLGSRKQSLKYFPLIATIFLFVMFSNWFGLLPGVGTVGLWHHTEHGQALVPLFRAPTADLNFTIALAIISIISVNFFGIVALGFRRHSSKFFNFKNPIFSFVGLLELVSEFVKIISFSFRLFGNVFAGEVLLTIIAFLSPYVIPLPFLFLEVFVGLIQAFIFSILTLVFVAMSVAHEPAH